jgi:plastocyanin
MRRTPLAIAAASLVLALPLTACGGDDGGTADPPPSNGGGGGSELVVHGKDTLKWDKDAYTAKAGTIDVRLVNDGSVNHTLLIKDVDDFELKVPGTDEGTVELEAGTYTLYCDVAGHEAAGMTAELTVS